MTIAVATSFDGFAVGAGTGYLLILNPNDTDASLGTSATIRDRTNQTPIVDARSYGPLRIPFVVVNQGVASNTFNGNVMRYFVPHHKDSRTLVATHPDGVTELEIEIDYIENLLPGMRDYSGVFVAAEAAYRETTVQTATASPFTVGGNFPALPILTITPPAPAYARRRVTILDICGRGVAAYPVRAIFDSTGLSATTSAMYEVFLAGRSVPFKVTAPDNAATKVDFRVDAPPQLIGTGLMTADLYYGGALSNARTADQLDDGGMDFASGSFAANQWVWSDFAIANFPAATGVWRPAKLGQTISGVSYGITAMSPSAITFKVDATTKLAEDADGMVLVVGVDAGATNALAGLSRVIIQTTGVINVRVMYRIAGQTTWTAAWTWTGGTTTTTAIDLDNAVEIAVLIEPADATSVGTLTLAASGTFGLALATPPTISVTDPATDANLYHDEAVINTTTGERITFTRVFTDDVDLVVDCLAKSIYVISGPLYREAISFSDVDAWMLLPVGSNAYSTPVGFGAVEWAWQNRWHI